MKKFNLVLITIQLLLVAPSIAEESNEHALRSELEPHEKRLKEIEERADKGRRVAEELHACRVSELWGSVENEIERQLSLPSRILLVEFAKMNSAEPYGYGYFDSSMLPFPSDQTVVATRGALIDIYFSTMLRQLVKDGGFRQTLSELADNKVLQYHVRREARMLLTIADRAHRNLTALQRSRDVKLSALDCWEEESKEKVLLAIDPTKGGARESQEGTVNIIGQDREGPFCVVEGVDVLLRPDDVISTSAMNGVRVLAISSEAVRFGKTSTTWEQKLGVSP